jgi:hypothetical protein
MMPFVKSHKTLIQSGRGIGPVKPQQPPKRREGAKSGRVSTLEDESNALRNCHVSSTNLPSPDESARGFFMWQDWPMRKAYGKVIQI